MSRLGDPDHAAEVDDFLARAEAVHAAVTGLAHGTLQPADTNHILADMDKRTPIKVDPLVQAYRDDQKAKDDEARKRAGIPGQGARPGYAYFCRGCFREYELVPIDNKLTCAACSSSLITRDERMVELQHKVSILQQTKAERATRRKQYAEWKKEKAAREEGPKMVVLSGGKQEESKEASVIESSSLSSKYQDWELWEPSSDEEAEVPQPDHPAFAAMKSDMEARDKRKRDGRIVSEKANERGAACVKAKDYLCAIEAYTCAVDNTKGEKSYYTNRALCFIHTFDYARAVQDCSTALDIYECFEKEHTRYRVDYKNMKIVLKAALRKTKAQIGLALFKEAKESLKLAVEICKDVYSNSNRKDPVYAKAEKDELKEIEKLRQEIEEKLGFEKEEQQVAIPPSNNDNSSVAPSAQTNAALPQPDSNAITQLMAEITTAHSSLSNAGVEGEKPSWACFQPVLRLLVATIESSGNKERIVSDTESRVCVDVLLKLSSHAAPVQPAAGDVTKLPLQLPQFAHVPSIYKSASSVSQANLICWRERDGFRPLGKYMMQLFKICATQLGAIDTDIRTQVVRIISNLTDRERAREYFVLSSHAQVVTDIALNALTSGSLDGSNLLANLAFQPNYRAWLTQEKNEAVLGKMYRDIMLQTRRCTLSNGQGNTSDDPLVGKVLASQLSIIINLLSSQACRVRFIEDESSASNPNPDSSSSKNDSPVRLLLAAVDHITAEWQRVKFVIQSRSSLADVSDKLLSIMMNLCVDDFANMTIFGRMQPSTIKGLLALIKQPGAISNPKVAASATSTISTVPAILIERALGTLTRGLRREHNVFGGNKSAPRTIRNILVENGGVESFIRILTLAPYAVVEDINTSDSVLAKLQSNSDDVTSSSSSSSSSHASSTSTFRYTRLTMDHASVCLAVCMSQDASVAKQVTTMSYQGVSSLQLLVDLLSSCHKIVAGNACLCVDAIAAVPELVTRPELAASLEPLLSILKDPSARSSHQNAAKAAILIGRAPNNAERWAAMRGVQIISTVLNMK